MFLDRTFEVITLWIRPSAPRRLVSGCICSCDAGGLGCDRSNAFSLRGEGSCQCHSGNNQLSNVYGKSLGVTLIGTDPVWLCGRCQPEVVQGGIEFNSSTRHRGSAPPSFRAPRSRNVPKGCHAISSYKRVKGRSHTVEKRKASQPPCDKYTYGSVGIHSDSVGAAAKRVRTCEMTHVADSPFCSRAATISTYPHCCLSCRHGVGTRVTRLAHTNIAGPEEACLFSNQPFMLALQCQC